MKFGEALTNMSRVSKLMKSICEPESVLHTPEPRKVGEVDALPNIPLIITGFRMFLNDAKKRMWRKLLHNGISQPTPFPMMS